MMADAMLDPGRPVLVTYATGSGSTTGVAEAVGRALTQAGAAVQVRPVPAVRDLSLYRAVVVGGAVQRGQWLPEAMQFVRKHQAALSRMPFAAFLVCITLAMPGAERYRPMVAGYLEPVRQLVRPVSEGLFAGVLDLGKVPSAADRLKFRLSVALGVWKEGDHRDWGAIHRWGTSLEPLLAQDNAG